MPVGKEAESSETFSEDDYRDKLVGDGYSEESAKMLAKKKKEQLANQATKKIEIDLGSLAKVKKRVWVKSTSSRKGHYREQEVGEKADRAKSLRSVKSKLVQAEKRGDEENIKILKNWIKKLNSGGNVDFTEEPSGYGKEVSGVSPAKLSES